ncbi:retrovirus-related pol polyprotein from transposon TNT 1-94, partial [Tanacetum coccineum]
GEFWSRSAQNRRSYRLCPCRSVGSFSGGIDEWLPNGLVERMNRTLLNKVRCLLIQFGFPDSFWVEATVTAAYLINKSPSTALEKKTPMDFWSEHPASYEMLRIFGYIAYLHVNQGKLKPRAMKCIFLGYPEGVKGYRYGG